MYGHAAPPYSEEAWYSLGALTEQEDREITNWILADPDTDTDEHAAVLVRLLTDDGAEEGVDAE